MWGPAFPIERSHFRRNARPELTLALVALCHLHQGWLGHLKAASAIAQQVAGLRAPHVSADPPGLEQSTLQSTECLNHCAMGAYSKLVATAAGVFNASSLCVSVEQMRVSGYRITSLTSLTGKPFTRLKGFLSLSLSCFCFLSLLSKHSGSCLAQNALSQACPHCPGSRGQRPRSSACAQEGREVEAGGGTPLRRCIKSSCSEA